MTKATIMSGIYSITNTLSGRVYVGQSVDLNRRFYMHRRSLRRGDHACRWLQMSWIKHGEENFRFAVLEVLSDLEQLTTREQAWMDQYRDYPGLFNTCPAAGSPRGIKRSPDAVARHAAMLRGRPGHAHTAESRAKISASNIGKSASEHSRRRASEVHKGKTISSEHKAAIGTSSRSRNWSEESREKISAALQGREITPEWRAKISQSSRGKVISEETKAKISASMKAARARRRNWSVTP